MPFLQVDDDTLARLKELHRKRSLGVATGWQELDTVLAGLLGPLERRKRCERCGGEGIICDKTYQTSTQCSCPACNGKGYTCERCNNKGRIGLGTELTMACPVCGEGGQ